MHWIATTIVDGGVYGKHRQTFRLCRHTLPSGLYGDRYAEHVDPSGALSGRLHSPISVSLVRVRTIN